MKVRTRINPKTGKTDYKVRYSWKDGEGKRKDSETAWFLTEKQLWARDTTAATSILRNCSGIDVVSKQDSTVLFLYNGNGKINRSEDTEGETYGRQYLRFNYRDEE